MSCLVVFHKQLGDLVLLEPAISRLAGHFGTPVDVLTRRGHGALVQLIPDARPVDTPRDRRYEALFCYDRLRKSAWLSLLAAARRKEVILTFRQEAHWYHRIIFRAIHASRLQRDYLAEYQWKNTPLPAIAPFRPPRLHRPPPDWAPDKFAQHDYVLISPTAGWKKKNWSAVRWGKVIQQLRTHGISRFVVTGGGQHWQVEHSRTLAERAGPGVELLAGTTSLKNFLWMIANARMVLAVDGAASHCASAFDVPCATIFRIPNACNWHYPTPRAVAVTLDYERRSELGDAEIEQVAGAALRLWTR